MYNPLAEVIAIDREFTGANDEGPDPMEPGEPILCAECGEPTGWDYEPDEDNNPFCRTCEEALEREFRIYRYR